LESYDLPGKHQEIEIFVKNVLEIINEEPEFEKLYFDAGT